MRSAALLALAALSAQGIELSTGKMLGAGHDVRSFYVRDKPGQPWRKTYSGPGFKPAAAGRMMNLRIAQGVTHDEWLKEVKFDPDANTERVIAALDEYREHGVLAISVSLQGANAAYERSATIKRTRPYKLGPEKGSYNSAFTPDGRMKPAWMARLLKLARALDQRGMILNPMVFYGYQDEVLENRAAVDRALLGFADWLIEHNVRNVLVEIANEYDSNEYDHDQYIRREMAALTTKFKARFEQKRAGWRPPVGASTLAKAMLVHEDMAKAADLTMVHGNNRTAEFKRARVGELAASANAPGPIYMNEDNNGRETTRANLEQELASCTGVFEAGGSWGYMPWVQAQIWPFRSYRAGKSPEVRDEMKVEERDLAYFKAVLEKIRSLVRSGY